MLKSLKKASLLITSVINENYLGLTIHSVKKGKFKVKNECSGLVLQFCVGRV